MAKVRQTKDEPTVIKKYANRRLYDTGRSSYVTLNDLSDMVREGYNFVVQDAKTGKDITRSVLAQIIVEKESDESESGEAMLGTGFLRKLIGLYGNGYGGTNGMQAFMPKYLENTLDVVLKNQEMLREQMTKSMQSMGQQMGGINGMKGMNPMSAMNAMQNNPMMKGMFPMPGLEEISKQNMAAFERTMKMFTPFGSGFGSGREDKD